MSAWGFIGDLIGCVTVVVSFVFVAVAILWLIRIVVIAVVGIFAIIVAAKIVWLLILPLLGIFLMFFGVILAILASLTLAEHAARRPAPRYALA